MVRRNPAWRRKGFTLIELMIGVAILGLLVSLAIAGYQNFMKKAQTVEAELALGDLRKLQETYFSENNTYTNDLSLLGFHTVRPLKTYTIAITLGQDEVKGIGKFKAKGKGTSPILYEAAATGNLDGDPDLDAWVLTVYEDGSSTLSHGCIPQGQVKVDFGCVD